MDDLDLYTQIQKNKTQKLTQEIFEDVADYIGTRVEIVYQNALEAFPLEDIYKGYFYAGDLYVRNGLSGAYLRWLNLDHSLDEQAEQVKIFIAQVRRDVRFIQMWLSTFVKLDDPVGTKEKFPSILIEIDKEYKDIPITKQVIPEGKEELWEKATSIIEYYQGLRMVL